MSKRLADLLLQNQESPEQKLYNAYVGTTQALNESRKPSEYYKPSSLGGCMRNIVFQRLQYETDDTNSIDFNIIDMGKTGSARHEHIQEVIMKAKENGYDVEWVDVENYIKSRNLDYLTIRGRQGAELKLLDTRYNLSFLCDGIIKIDSKYYLLEIKTEISFKNSRRMEIDERHYTQAYCYSLAFGIKDVIFFYENRDDLSKKIYRLQVKDSDIKKYVLDVIDECEEYIKNEKMPPKHDNTYYCKYCNYQEECKRW